MEDIFYNILWIDDEHETLSGTKGRAKRNGINLIPFKSLNGGMSELERNYPFYDGVLLDAKFFENEDDVMGSEDTYNVHRAKELLLQLKKKFEVFVLTGQAEAYEDKTFKKAFTKVYKKGSDEEIDRLFADIKKAAATQEDTQLRQAYKRVFEVCTDNYLGKDAAISLLEAIKNANDEGTAKSKDNFLRLRKLLELLFEKLNQIGIVPDGIFHSKGWFNPTSDFLTGKSGEYTIKESVIHPSVSFILRQLKEITQDAEHNVDEKLRLKTDDFIIANGTSYLYKSALSQLCDVLIWFKTFIDNYRDVEANKSLHIRSVAAYNEIFTGTIEQDAKGNYYCGEYLLNYNYVKNNYKISDKIEVLEVADNSNSGTKAFYGKYAVKFKKVDN